MPVPFVSVCIITFNHGKYIRQCLEGILMQNTNFHFDVIIGEDCSTDNTKEIVKEFEKRFPDIIKPIYQQKNVGGARNGYEFCFPRLMGKYVAICEGDDYWTDPDKLQKQVDYLEQNPEYSFCFHRVQAIDYLDNVIDGQVASDLILSYNKADIYHISIPTLSVVFKKCFETIPAEMFNVKSGDTFLFGMLAGYGKAADLGFIGARYRKHEGGMYNSLSQFNQFRQAIATRQIMLKCNVFSNENKKEIKREIIKRKKFYLRYFIKKKEILNSFKIIIV